MRGDACRERAPGGQYLAAFELVAVHGEGGDGVASGVDREQQVGTGLVGERALRCEVVWVTGGDDPAKTARGVGARGGEATSDSAVIGNDRVACGIVGLNEHRMSGIGWQDGCGGRGCGK